ncbi:hypothetical protein [Streptomyces sp. NPDC055085]
MAIGDDYVDRATLKAYMKFSPDDYEDQVDAVASSASREIKRFCRRQFNKESTASARSYAAVRPNLVVVDDFWTDADLVVATDDDGDGVFETVWTAADFTLLPLNGVQDGMPGWPYWRIQATGRNGRDFPGGCGSPRVQVTAQWGWVEVPQQVIEACKMIASDGFQYMDTRMGAAGMDQFGTILRVKDNGMAASKLKRFRRGRVMVR